MDDDAGNQSRSASATSTTSDDEPWAGLVDAVGDGRFRVDDAGRFIWISETFVELAGYSRAALHGERLTDVLATVDETTETAIERVAAGDATTPQVVDVPLQRPAGTLVPCRIALRACDGDEPPGAACGVVTPYEDQRGAVVGHGRERELQRYETIVETIEDGVYVVDDEYNFVLVNDAYADLTGYDRSELVGSHCSLVVGETVSEMAASMGREMIEGEREVATIEASVQTADGRTVPAESRFTALPPSADGAYRGTVGVVRDISERMERERALQRQREQLAALNRLNQVVQEITHAVVESSSRDEIERLVCERLADTESYLFAWIAEVDHASETVVQRVEAGVDGYLDEVTATIEDGGVGDGPLGKAVRTREPQIVRDALADAAYEPWRDVAREYGYRSIAAIPICYEDVRYGVLCVYTERVGAFDDHERTVLVQLGNVVGHAITALERKEALISDQVVEVQLSIADMFADVESSVAGSISFDRTVPIGERTYLEYGTATPDAVEHLEAMVESIPHFEAVSLFETRRERVPFELRLSEPPVISTLATYGGRVTAATIEDGDYDVTVELPAGADVRSVVEAIRRPYPTLEVVGQRRKPASGLTVQETEAVLAETLTDRQRATLETAYLAGYFDTPRRRNGEAIASSLDISAPTLHQHLRKGQRKLLEAVFGDST